MPLNEFLAYQWLGNPVERWLLAALVIIVATTALWGLKQLAVKRLSKFSARTRTDFDDLLVDLLSRTRVMLIFLATISPATALLTFRASAHTALRIVSVIALLIQIGIWGNAFITFWADRYTRRGGDGLGAGTTAVSTMAVLARMALGGLLILFLLDNLGVDVTALLAGLGIGGIIIALSLQNMVGDMLAAMGILVGKPFVVGDFIEAQGLMGTVESVGLRATRMRTLSGDELIFPNRKLLEGTIRNYTRMTERRVDFRIAVTYGTPPAKLERIPTIAREAVGQHPLVRFDRAHFRALRDWSLEFDVIYIIASGDFNVYADIQQQINLELMRRLEAEGIELAMPTQVVDLKTVRNEEWRRRPNEEGGTRNEERGSG
ncbi:MAG TPA: mechanosensitive ion channel family protein [Gemmatimonadaceae bacterium]|nr:mechanosensitive ion channel family protein [Gemmatimonadaceae bacterium]